MEIEQEVETEKWVMEEKKYLVHEGEVGKAWIC
jgi:hypothetical protein